ncbi:hypothetical protein DP939_29850 [Spongiactinospora rosea]|uniref:Magnesium transporter MgtE intracellular domain-containing protein n=1 Tax=Spongiactinospora rosea TaxID=2248750 RepID=A0A366LT78_9ACTN|nr:helix-turn-helix domain-containing protein [Spongiactinospora rosea]RBQ16524.1 hypothetical protein DP939_29850 [Spongiactinospora rosea]
MVDHLPRHAPARPYRPGVEADPGSVTTKADLARELRKLRIASGKPSLRELGRRARADHGLELPRSTAGNAESGKVLPRWEVILAFVLACGIGPAGLRHWQAAWQRASASGDTRLESMSGGPESAHDEYIRRTAGHMEIMPPAAAAELLAATAPALAAELLTVMNTKPAAELLTAIDPSRGAELLTAIDPSRAVELLRAINPPSRAVGLLAVITPARAVGLMAGMTPRPATALLIAPII